MSYLHQRAHAAKAKERFARDVEPRRRNPHRLVGLSIIGLLIPIAGGRWGSYLSVPGLPVFFTDLLVAIGLLALVSSRAGRKSTSIPVVHTPRILVFGSLAISVIVAVALMFAAWDEPLLVVRDAMPFVYLSLTPFIFQAVVLTGKSVVLRWLQIACAFHTLWFSLAVFRLLPQIDLAPLSGVPIFTTRSDFDLLISALTIAVFMLDKSTHAFLRTLIMLAAGVSLLAGGSRAGLLSGLFLLAVAFFFARVRKTRVPPVAVAIAAITVAVTLPLLVLVLTEPPEWMRGLGRLFDVGSAEQASAQNTWNARLFAWERLLTFTFDEPTRALWGSGLGSQPVLDSGALVHLSGNTTVRAAHNFLVTWVAFIGVVGAGIVFAILIAWLLAAVVNTARNRETAGLGLAFTGGLLLAGLGGVIVESPFGYMSLVLAVTLALHKGALPPTRGLIKRQVAPKTFINRAGAD